MAFTPAHCDSNCLGCEKNKDGWCVWKDRATIYYMPKAFKAEEGSEKSHIYPETLDGLYWEKITTNKK